MKKVLSIPVVLLVLAFFVSSAFASGLVTDETGYLTAGEIESLEEMCEEIGNDYGIVAMIRMVDETPGYTESESQRGYYGLRQYAADYYDARHSGEDGVIFAVRMSDRWYVSVTTGRGESILTTSRLDACENAAKSYLSSGQYYSAFRAYLRKVSSYLGRGSSVTEPDSYTYGWDDGYTSYHVETDPVTAVKEKLPIIGIFSAVITALVLLLVRRSMRTARKNNEAGSYISNAQITMRQDLYLYTSKTRRKIQTDSGSHGSGGHFGGGGGHGSSHGGRF